jgi:hypothetical protein
MFPFHGGGDVTHHDPAMAASALGVLQNFADTFEWEVSAGRLVARNVERDRTLATQVPDDCCVRSLPAPVEMQRDIDAFRPINPPALAAAHNV